MNSPGDSVPGPASPGLLWTGAAGLVVAVVCSGVLVLHHWGGMSLPGCGPGSPCAQAAASELGTVPGTAWPTSHVGLAFFVAMLAGWLAGRNRRPAEGFLFLARLGAVISILLVLSLFTQGFLCPYCLGTHLGNLLFWIAAERAFGPPALPGRATAVAVGGFALITLLLAPIERGQKAQAVEQAARDVDASVEDVLARTMSAAPTGFVGRLVTGADPAALRIVVLSDYQCDICGRVEQELKRALNERDDVALSVKHFPLSSDCNSFARERGINMHPNACRAAAVAEAAAVLGGNDLFWRVHEELFRRGGQFTDGELDGLIRSWGQDVRRFREVMAGDAVQTAIQADIQEGIDLGLHFTPMVFINGVQIRGVHQRGMVTRAIAKIAAARPPPVAWSAANDRPASAGQKLFDDWKAGRKVALPADLAAWPMGAPGPAPALSVVVWGDYQEQNTRSMDEVLRKRIENKGDLRYVFRHFPFDNACNPMTSKTAHPQACLAARAVEAAGLLGGHETWVKMHRWLWPNHKRFSEDTFGKVARGLGLDSEQYLAAFGAPEVEAALQEDIAGGIELNIRSIPTIYVNGRKLPRWTLKGEPYLDILLDQIAMDQDQGAMAR